MAYVISFMHISRRDMEKSKKKKQRKIEKEKQIYMKYIDKKRVVEIKCLIVCMYVYSPIRCTNSREAEGGVDDFM